LQVLTQYAAYGDAVLGRFGRKPDGTTTPNVRVVVKPLLGLFHGEPGGRRWRQMLDAALLGRPALVSEVIQVGGAHGLC
jgi:tRNA-dihydrouridine synthase A